VSPADRVIALSQDYGFRLAYYGWIVVQPYQGIEKFVYDPAWDMDTSGNDSRLFAAMMSKYDVFIITRMQDFREDPFLSQELNTHYRVLQEGGGYRIYDLRERLD
jgi:hypothetical protein